jgi:hypothetical protein
MCYAKIKLKNAFAKDDKNSSIDALSEHTVTQ